MANKTLNNVHILLRSDTFSNWTATNPVLLRGEIGFETDTLKFKFGNGVDSYGALSYASSDTAITFSSVPLANNWNYKIGSVAVNTATGKAYILINNAEDAAIWKELVTIEQLEDMLENLGAGDMLQSIFAKDNATKNNAGYVDKAIIADKLTTARTLSISGDATGNTTFDGTSNKSIFLTLADSGVTSGTYSKVTVDSKGRVTVGENLVADDIPSIPTNKVVGITNFEMISKKGAASGYAGLDTNQKILMENIPDAIVGQLVHAGELNASTAVATLTVNGQTILGTTDSTITLTNNTSSMTGYIANQGNYFVTTVSGTFAAISFAIGDWLVANASGWSKIDNTDAVVSVNGKSGVITLQTTDISENTNLYYTETRATDNFNTNFELKSSSELTDGNTIIHSSDTLILNGGNASMS